MNGKELTQTEAGKLWEDVQNYFVELFTERPELERKIYQGDLLLMDLDARYGQKYDASALVQLVSNGHQIDADTFVFMRKDFINVKPKHLEEMAP